MTVINSEGNQSCIVPKNATNIQLANQGTKVANIEITTEDGVTDIQKTVDGGHTVNCPVTGNGPYTVTNKSKVNVDVTSS
ncbi:MAG: hypothetical protein ACLQFI_22955 [Methylocella sp.]